MKNHYMTQPATGCAPRMLDPTPPVEIRRETFNASCRRLPPISEKLSDQNVLRNFLAGRAPPAPVELRRSHGPPSAEFRAARRLAEQLDGAGRTLCPNLADPAPARSGRELSRPPRGNI